MTTRKPKAIGYLCREADGGLALERRQLRLASRSLGWDKLKILRDEPGSESRRAWYALLEHLRSGEYSAVLIPRLCNLGCTINELYVLLDCCRRHECAVIECPGGEISTHLVTQIEAICNMHQATLIARRAEGTRRRSERVKRGEPGRIKSRVGRAAKKNNETSEEVRNLLASGLSVSEVSRRLGISNQSVYYHKAKMAGSSPILGR